MNKLNEISIKEIKSLISKVLFKIELYIKIKTQDKDEDEILQSIDLSYDDVDKLSYNNKEFLVYSDGLDNFNISSNTECEDEKLKVIAKLKLNNGNILFIPIDNSISFISNDLEYKKSSIILDSSILSNSIIYIKIKDAFKNRENIKVNENQNEYSSLKDNDNNRSNIYSKIRLYIKTIKNKYLCEICNTEYINIYNNEEINEDHITQSSKWLFMCSCSLKSKINEIVISSLSEKLKFDIKEFSSNKDSQIIDDNGNFLMKKISETINKKKVSLNEEDISILYEKIINISEDVINELFDYFKQVFLYYISKFYMYLNEVFNIDIHFLDNSLNNDDLKIEFDYNFIYFFTFLRKLTCKKAENNEKMIINNDKTKINIVNNKEYINLNQNYDDDSFNDLSIICNTNKENSSKMNNKNLKMRFDDDSLYFTSNEKNSNFYKKNMNKPNLNHNTNFDFHNDKSILNIRNNNLYIINDESILSNIYNNNKINDCSVINDFSNSHIKQIYKNKTNKYISNDEDSIIHPYSINKTKFHINNDESILNPSIPFHKSKKQDDSILHILKTNKYQLENTKMERNNHHAYNNRKELDIINENDSFQYESPISAIPRRNFIEILGLSCEVCPSKKDLGLFLKGYFNSVKVSVYDSHKDNKCYYIRVYFDIDIISNVFNSIPECFSLSINQNKVEFIKGINPLYPCLKVD